MSGPRLVPREGASGIARVGVPLGTAALAALAALALFAAVGAPPAQALATLVREPLTTSFGLTETLREAAPLLLCTLSVIVGNRVGLWNIGAEGQLALGAAAAAGVALHLGPLPGPIEPGLALLAAAVAGALWALPPALLRVGRGLSEILSTLLLNYVALAWLKMLVFGPWKGPDGFPYTAMIGESWRLATPIGRVHLGLPLAVALALGLGVALRGTVLGNRVRLVGASEPAAAYAGVPVGPLRVGAFALAGALAGLAGGVEVLGVQHRLHMGVASGVGYTALLAAFLAGARPLPGVLSALGLAALAVGGEAVQISFPGVSAAMVSALQGLILLGVVAGNTLRTHRVRWGRA